MQKLLLSVFMFCSFLMAAEPSPTLTETAPKNYWSPLEMGLDLSYSALSYKDHVWLDGATNQTRGHSIRVALEWIPLGDSPYGKPTIGVASGFNWINRAGFGAAYANFYAVPVTPYLGYRLEYFVKQVLIPYGKIGLNYTFSRQETFFEEGKRITEKPYLGLDYSLGVELCLNVIDQASVRRLDSSMGINGVYLFAEYNKSRSLGAKWANLSHEEIQFGMRFEF